jgi:hypothetical protein
MTTIDRFRVDNWRGDDSSSLLEAILDLERPEPAQSTAARRARPRLVAPVFGLRMLSVCAAAVLAIAATACVGLVQVAGTSGQLSSAHAVIGSIGVLF